MKTRIVIACAALVACTGSRCTPTPRTIPCTDAADAGADAESYDEVGNTSACARACTNLTMLGCPEAQTVDGGLSCTSLCARVQRERLTDLRPSCIANAPSVAAVRACGSVRCQLR